MSAMTPREAADAIERDNREHPGSVELTSRVRVLIDHARATSPAPEGGDLAAKIVTALDGAGLVDWVGEVYAPGRDWSFVSAREVADCLASVLAPAPSVATPPQRQPENFDRTPGVGCAARDGGEHWPGAGRDWRECIDCDEWPYAAAPPAEGEAV